MGRERVKERSDRNIMVLLIWDNSHSYYFSASGFRREVLEDFYRFFFYPDVEMEDVYAQKGKRRSFLIFRVDI